MKKDKWIIKKSLKPFNIDDNTWLYTEGQRIDVIKNVRDMSIHIKIPLRLFMDKCGRSK